MGARHPREPPRPAAPAGLPPTQPRAPRRGLGLLSGAPWQLPAQGQVPAIAAMGARRLPQATRARMPPKFGSGSAGSEMQPTPRFSQPRANKHSARTQTARRPRSERRVWAAGGQSRARDPRGAAARRCDVSARRYSLGSTAQRPARSRTAGRGTRWAGRSGRKGAGEEARGDLSCAAAAGTVRRPACGCPPADPPGPAAGGPSDHGERRPPGEDERMPAARVCRRLPWLARARRHGRTATGA